MPVGNEGKLFIFSYCYYYKLFMDSNFTIDIITPEIHRVIFFFCVFTTISREYIFGQSERSDPNTCRCTTKRRISRTKWHLIKSVFVFLFELCQRFFIRDHIFFWLEVGSSSIYNCSKTVFYLKLFLNFLLFFESRFNDEKSFFKNASNDNYTVVILLERAVYPIVAIYFYTDIIYSVKQVHETNNILIPKYYFVDAQAQITIINRYFCSSV